MRSIVCICVLVLFSSQIQAAPSGTIDWKTKAPASEIDRPELTLDVRLLGGPLGTFIDEPSEANKLNSQAVRIPYSGFGGLGYSMGLTLGLTYDQFIGFETGLISRSEKATATYNINGGSYDIEVTQSTLTVPLLIRLTLPTDSVQPSLLFGMGLHFPSDTALESLNLTRLDAEASSYQTLNFGFELEFKLPVKQYDIRIPLSLRGYHNQNLGASAAERIDSNNCDPTGLICDNTFITEWQWAAEILLGLSIHTQLLN
jgi:hypothetical protein